MYLVPHSAVIGAAAAAAAVMSDFGEQNARRFLSAKQQNTAV